ncbi:MAG: Oxygen regulatory protein NreC [Anaerolineae bacterium]|nr:Oxygen regulatory protein NreC [Anaerolineae bacterium]
MRLLIIDDHILFREGLVGLLNGQPGIEVVGQAGTVAEAVTLAEQLNPDLILMDFGLPDGSGLEATQAILAERPETSIVFLTVHDQDDRLFAAIRAGAKGYLLKNVPLSNLLAYIRGVELGEAAISLTMTSHILKEFLRLRPPTDPQPGEDTELTWRELEVLRELASGATNHEIAEHLVIAENTVKVHVHHILAKLNLRNRREAINYARSRGLV